MQSGELFLLLAVFYFPHEDSASHRAAGKRLVPPFFFGTILDETIFIFADYIAQV